MPVRASLQINQVWNFHSRETRFSHCQSADGLASQACRLLCFVIDLVVDDRVVDRAGSGSRDNASPDCQIVVALCAAGKHYPPDPRPCPRPPSSPLPPHAPLPPPPSTPP